MQEPSLSVTDQFRAELDRNFRAPLLNYFMRRVGSRAEAEDMTQDVFARVLHHLERVEPAQAKSYIFTVAANLLRDRARQLSIRNVCRLDDMAPLTPPNLVEEITPERVIVYRQTLSGVLSALESLGQKTRDIFVLYRIEAMKQHEIASLYGISQSSVEKHLAKAIAHLAERFERS